MKRISLFGSLALILVVVALYFFVPGFRQWCQEAFAAFSSADMETIRDFLNDYRSYGYLVLLIAFLVQMFLFVLPSIMVMTLCILMYGPVIGVVLCIVGIGLAASIAYWIGELLGDVTVDRMVGQKARTKMSRTIEDYGFWTVAICRLSPFFSNDAVSLVAGLVSMGYWRFIAATIVGIVPLSVLLAWVGENSDQLQTGLTIVSVLGFAALALVVYLDRRRRPDHS